MILGEATGTLHFMVADRESDREPCMCCPGGRHVFACGLRIDQKPAADWLDRAIYSHRDKRTTLNGRRVKITVELEEEDA